MVVRRSYIIALLIVAVVGSVSAETESWLYGGFEYSKAFETTHSSGSVIHSTMDSVGANLSAFTFWNRGDIGLYTHDSFLLPRSGTISAAGQTYSADLTAYDSLYDLGIVVGPGFRRPLSKSATLYGGVGMHGMELLADKSLYISGVGTVQYSELAFNIGLGADAGIKVDLGTAVSFVWGVSAVYDPLNYTSISTSYSGSTAQRSSDYSFISVDSYVGFGRNFYRTGTSVGKPK